MKPLRDFDELDKQAERESKAITKIAGLRPKKKGHQQRKAFGSGFYQVKE